MESKWHQTWPKRIRCRLTCDWIGSCRMRRDQNTIGCCTLYPSWTVSQSWGAWLGLSLGDVKQREDWFLVRHLMMEKQTQVGGSCWCWTVYCLHPLRWTESPCLFEQSPTFFFCLKARGKIRIFFVSLFAVLLDFTFLKYTPLNVCNCHLNSERVFIKRR